MYYLKNDNEPLGKIHILDDDGTGSLCGYVNLKYYSPYEEMPEGDLCKLCKAEQGFEPEEIPTESEINAAYRQDCYNGKDKAAGCSGGVVEVVHPSHMHFAALEPDWNEAEAGSRSMMTIMNKCIRTHCPTCKAGAMRSRIEQLMAFNPAKMFRIGGETMANGSDTCFQWFQELQQFSKKRLAEINNPQNHPNYNWEFDQL